MQNSDRLTAYPIRVLQVLTIMNRGGAETMVMNYYRHIDRNKIQFDFLLHRQERGAYDDEIESMGGRIFRIPPIFNFFAHQKAVRQFFNDHPEYQIIHGHVGELGYCIYKEAKQRGIPTIIAHAHNAACDRDWKWPIRTVLKHLIRPYVTTPMTCGTDAAKWLFGKTMAKKAIMLNNAIDAQKYAFNEKIRNQVRRDMGWEGHWVIGDVARFSPPKNHMGLLSIFQAVLRKEPKALLVLIGEKTGLYEEVKQKAEAMGIAHAVQFLGTRTDIPRLLQGMDVYCSPSLYEGLSVSMVEAQASGLKVIATDRVPKQVAICPKLLKFLPLSLPSSEWIKEIIKPYDRNNTYPELNAAMYDIRANGIKLQNFYLQRNTEL